MKSKDKQSQVSYTGKLNLNKLTELLNSDFNYTQFTLSEVVDFIVEADVEVIKHKEGKFKA